jgi:hypothetical protein
MNTAPKEAILSAVRSLLGPFIGILLDAGIGFRELAQVLKMEFVSRASDMYGVRGRPTNISRIAVMTGLTRKEIRSIRKDLEKSGKEFFVDIEKLNPATVLLHAWFSDPEFQDADGHPRQLPISGSSYSFASLCKKYAGDIPHGAMLAELRRAGSIEELQDGSILPVSRFFTPIEFDERFLGSMAFSLGNLSETLVLNARYSSYGNKDDLASKGLLERYVWSSDLTDEDVAEFKKYSEIKAAELLADLDGWIGKRERRNPPGYIPDVETTDDKPKDRVGLGLYFFDSRSGRKS